MTNFSATFSKSEIVEGIPSKFVIGSVERYIAKMGEMIIFGKKFVLDWL